MTAPRDWSLSSCADADAPGCELVRQWLREHNWSANPLFMQRREEPQHQPRPLVLLARAAEETLGGLLGETQFAWLRVAILAVAPARRGQGIGGALLAEAEKLAVDRGCRYAYADTMEHQSPQFYLARGFELAGQLPDWDSHGHRKIFLFKRLL